MKDSILSLHSEINRPSCYMLFLLWKLASFVLLLTTLLDIGSGFWMLDAQTCQNGAHPSKRKIAASTNEKKNKCKSLSLVPSQVLSQHQPDSPLSTMHRSNDGKRKPNRAKPRRNRQLGVNQTSSAVLVPSQVILARPETSIELQNRPQTRRPRTRRNQESDSSDTKISDVAAQQNNGSKSKRRRKRPMVRKVCTSVDDKRLSSLSHADETSRKAKQPRSPTGRPKRARTGNLPDIEWRALPMDDLRLHPNFVPLKLPDEIGHIDNLEDARQFRQDSWQWAALHSGRCTTSQAASALGLLEPLAGQMLGIPQSLRHGGLGAYHRLSEEPEIEPTLIHMNRKLCNNGNRRSKQEYQATPIPWEQSKLKASVNNRFPFAAKYKLRITEKDRQQRRLIAETLAREDNMFDTMVRLKWGTAQEATALLTALNFFWAHDKNIVLKEVGMCGAGLALSDTNYNNNSTTRSEILVGASPDALMYHPDGRVEVIEVKNHCPFRINLRSSPKRNKRLNSTVSNKHRFSIQNFAFDETSGVLPQYVPQLMMEMLCVGPACQSAIMVRQTATNGALIVRIMRDDAWIDEMLFWLHRFQREYVEPGIPPPENFFWCTGGDEDISRYKKFVQWTKELESKVRILGHVPNSKIQRVLGTSSRAMDLFLD